MQKELGWSLSVFSLNYWVRGLPVPGVECHISYDASHRIHFLQQQNWTIQFLAYHDVEGLELPQEIIFTTAGLNLHLIIETDSWKIKF